MQLARERSLGGRAAIGSSTMQHLGWRDRDESRVSWFAAPGVWLGRWQCSAARSGGYASSRGAMASVLCDGRMHIELGPTRRALSLSAGDVVFIGERTPFRYTLEAGSQLLVLDVGRGDGLGLAEVRSPRLSRLGRACADAPSEAALRALRHEAEATRPARRHPLELTHPTARVLAAKTELDARFREPVSMRRLAERLGMDTFYLSRNFARATGMPPKAYLQHLRREHFLRALLASRRATRERGALTRLAHEAGYGDYATFCRHIRRSLGVAPSQLHDDQVCPSGAVAGG